MKLQIREKFRLGRVGKSSGSHWRASNLLLASEVPGLWDMRLPSHGKPGSNDLRRPGAHSAHGDYPEISLGRQTFRIFHSN